MLVRAKGFGLALAPAGERMLHRRRVLHRGREMRELPRRAGDHAGLGARGAPRGARGGALQLGGRPLLGRRGKLARHACEGRNRAPRRRSVERRRPGAGAA
jgi:hypothetical protein